MIYSPSSIISLPPLGGIFYIKGNNNKRGHNVSCNCRATGNFTGGLCHRHTAIPYRLYHPRCLSGSKNSLHQGKKISSG